MKKRADNRFGKGFAKGDKQAVIDISLKYNDKIRATAKDRKEYLRFVVQVP